MNKLFLIVFLILICLCDYCEAKYKLSTKLLNFEDVQKGKKATRRFTINNTSGNMLDINKIHLSCSCLKSYYKKNMLLPEETMDVDITFDSVFKETGQYHYKIFLRTSDQDMPTNHIDIIVYVTEGNDKSLSFSPVKINFDKLNPKNKISKDIFITNNGKKAYKILSVNPGYGLYIPSYPEYAIEPGTTVKIPVYVKSGIKPGILRSNVTIATDDPLMPQFFCPVNGEISYKKN